MSRRKKVDFEILMPFFNLIKHGKPDYTGLDADFTWVHVTCNEWGPYFRLLEVLKPNDSILSQKSSGYGKKDVYFLATADFFDKAMDLVEEACGATYFRDNFTFEQVHPGTDKLCLATIMQLFINSLGNNSMVDASNAQGRFFQIVKHEDDKKRSIVSKYVSLEFKVDYSPDYLHDFSDLYFSYNVNTFNNALYEDIKWGNRGKDVETRFRNVPGAGMQTCKYRTEDDGNTFVLKSRKFEDKNHLDMLSWTRNPTKTEGEDTNRDVEKNLEESRSVWIFRVIGKLNDMYGEYFGGLSVYQCKAERLPTELDPIYLERLMGHFQGKTIHIDNKDRRKKGQDVIVCIYNLTESANNAVVEEFVGIVKDRYQLKLTITGGPKFGMYNVPIIYPKSYYEDDPEKDPHKDHSFTLMQHATIDNLKAAIKGYNKQVKSNNTRYENKKKKWLEEEPTRKEKDFSGEKPKLPNMPIAEVIFEQLYLKEDIEGRKITFYNWLKFGAEGEWKFAIPLKHSENHKLTLDGFACFSILKDGTMIEPEMYPPNDPFSPVEFGSLVWDDIEYAIVNPDNQVNIVRATHVNTIPDGDWVYGKIKDNKEKNEARTHDLKSPDAKMKVFGGSIDIGYVRLTDKRWIYYVGQYNNLNQSIANSSIVREIEAVGDSKVFFEELFHMMSIPFVKHNQNSVIPFPVKYLKEWSKQLGYYKEDVADKNQS